MNEKDSMSSSEPLANSNSSDDLFSGSLLYSTSNQSSLRGRKKNSSHKNKLDTDGDFSSSINLTSTIRRSLQKKQKKMETNISNKDQQIMKYHETDKKEAEASSAQSSEPSSPRSNKVSNNSEISNNNSEISINNKSSKENIAPLDNDPSIKNRAVDIKSKEKIGQSKEEPKNTKSKCCLLL